MTEAASSSLVQKASVNIFTNTKALESVRMGDKTSSSEQHKPFLILKSKSGTEHVHYSVVYEGFPDEFQAMAETELKETPEARKKGLKRLREYMRSQCRQRFKDDLPLMAALRNCKYDVKKAESKLKKLLSVRQAVSAQLRNLGMETVERIVDDTPFWIFPYRDMFGRVIVNTRPDAVNPADNYTFADVGTIAKAGLLFLLSFPMTSVSGFVYFGDCSAPPYMYYSIAKEIRTDIEVVQSIPVRIARVEILNDNLLYRSFYNLCKVLFSEKLMSRVTLHGTSLEQIHEMYSPDLLPEEYGGNAGPISSKPYKQKFLDFIRNLMDEDR